MPEGSSPSLISLLTDHPLPPDADLIHYEGRSWTIATIREAVSSFAATLRRSGAEPGDPIAALVTSGPTAVAQMFGAWEFGSPFVPLNGRLDDVEVLSLLESAPPAVVVAPANRPMPDGGAWSTITSYPDLTWTIRATTDSTVKRYPTDVAIVLRTSGTTGRPKTVFHTHRSMIRSIDLTVASIRGGKIRDGGVRKVNLIPVSLALSAGIYNTLFSLRVGAAIVLLERFDPNTFSDVIRHHEIRSTVLAPAMITMLADSPSVEALTPLRFVRSITAPLLPDEARRFHQRFGVAVLNGYGQTELGGEVVGWSAADWRDHKDDKLGSVGRPHDGVAIRILDPSTKEPVSTGITGDIHIRSPYLDEDHPDSGALTDRVDDGYIRTGDIGHLDDDGFLWIDGRESDMINRGGLKVMPDEVESVLLDHEAIREVCVTAGPDRRLGEVPVAWVVPSPGRQVDVDELAEWSRRRLSGYKVPVRFELVDALPRNEIGKVLRSELKQRAKGGGDPS